MPKVTGTMQGRRVTRRAVIGGAAAGTAVAAMPAAAQQQPSAGALGSPISTTLLELQPTDTTSAPFHLFVGSPTFSGTVNPVLYIGYNVAPPGTKLVAEDAYGAFVLETDYHDGSKRTMEQYFELRTQNDTNMRPLFFQIQRDATTPEEMLTNSVLLGSPINFGIPDNSQSATPGHNPFTVAAQVGADNWFKVLGRKAATDTFVFLEAPSGRSTQISFGHNAVGDVWRLGTVHANQMAWGLAARQILYLYATPNGGSGSAIAVGANDNSAAGVFSTAPSADSVKGVVIRRKATSTGNMLELQDNESTPLLSVIPSGALELLEQSDPAPPAANKARLYSRENEAGKTQLVVRFATGSEQVLATEPQ